MKSLGIYVHIPFCQKKCLYCDFTSFVVEEMDQTKYVDALIQEMKHYGSLIRDQYVVDTIFIGGGTPSLLSEGGIQSIIEALNDCFHISDHLEFSIEANPGTLSYAKLLDYRKMGINRLSMGLQSVCDKDLRLLGRIHTYQDFLKQFQYAREAGFQNINVDLIYNIPNQGMREFLGGLEQVVRLNPEHLSLYSLILEEGTKFNELYKVDDGCFLTEEEEEEMYHLIGMQLMNSQYHRYEISNYAKQGFECKHNLKYWTNREYLGLGIAAASYRNDVRTKNISDLGFYSRSANTISKIILNQEIFDEFHVVTRSEKKEEFIMLSLRTVYGISDNVYKELFKESFYNTFKEKLLFLQSKGLVIVESSVLDVSIRLTEAGMYVSNAIIRELIA